MKPRFQLDQQIRSTSLKIQSRHATCDRAVPPSLDTCQQYGNRSGRACAVIEPDLEYRHAVVHDLPQQLKGYPIISR